MFARNLALASLALASLAVSAPARAADDVSPREVAVMISSVALFVEQKCPGLRIVNAEYRRVSDQLDFDPATLSDAEAREVTRTIQIFAAQRDSCAVVYRSAASGPMKDMIRKR